ncbi:MAG: hypothetical protein ACRC2T_17135 [Thermoguttaceae bacterium]
MVAGVDKYRVSSLLFRFHFVSNLCEKMKYYFMLAVVCLMFILLVITASKGVNEEGIFLLSVLIIIFVFLKQSIRMDDMTKKIKELENEIGNKNK